MLIEEDELRLFFQRGSDHRGAQQTHRDLKPLSLSLSSVYVSHPLPPSLFSNRCVVVVMTLSPPSPLWAVYKCGWLACVSDRQREWREAFRTHGAEGRYDPCGDPRLPPWTAPYWPACSIYRWAVQLRTFPPANCRKLVFSHFQKNKFDFLAAFVFVFEKKIKCIFKLWGRRQPWVLHHSFEHVFWVMQEGGGGRGGLICHARNVGWTLTMPSQRRNPL